MKYKKKPVIIEAIQWTGENLKEVLDFTGKADNFEKYFKSFEQYPDFVRSDGNTFKIFTLEGVMLASVGDFIIRGIHGEHYPCKPEIFEMTYEKVID